VHIHTSRCNRRPTTAELSTTAILSANVEGRRKKKQKKQKQKTKNKEG
jgi:hypothetical protein